MALFLLAALIAEIIGTFAGFGATTVLLPLTLFLFPPKQAIVLVGAFHFLGTTFRTILFARSIHLRLALLFGIPSLVLAALGASLLPRIDPGFLTRLVGALIIFYALTGLLGRRLILPKHPLVVTIGGALVGFLAGLIGTAGALRGAFLTAWKLPPKVYLGTAAVMGLGADIVRVVIYQQTGLLQLTLPLFLTLATVALIGTYLGKTLAQKTQTQIFNRIVFLALLLAGLRLLL